MGYGAEGSWEGSESTSPPLLIWLEGVRTAPAWGGTTPSLSSGIRFEPPPLDCLPPTNSDLPRVGNKSSLGDTRARLLSRWLLEYSPALPLTQFPRGRCLAPRCYRHPLASSTFPRLRFSPPFSPLSACRFLSSLFFYPTTPWGHRVLPFNLRLFFI